MVEIGRFVIGMLMVLKVLAASIKLKYPMNDSLPNLDHARDRLLARLFTYRKEHDAHSLDDDDFDIFHLYGK